MRTLADRFHCPRCKGRLDTITAEALTGTPAGSLFCTLCEAIVPAPDGIPDFVGDRVVPDTHPQGLGGDPYLPDQDAARLWDLITVAAGTRWPASLGDVLELGCGAGRLTRPLALASAARSVVAVDSAMDSLRACRERISQDAQPGTAGVSLVRLSLAEDVLRDATFDMVVSLDAMTRAGDTRALLGLVMRVLRPGGCAAFVVPNRRYAQALCRALAQGVVLRRAREQAWTDQARGIIHMIGLLHRRYVHAGNATGLAGLKDRNLFEPEDLHDMAREAGFQAASVLPLDPDVQAGEAALRLCKAAGADDGFAAELASLALSAGAPYFNLLSRQDSTATSLLWLVKGIGPALQTFTAPPRRSAFAFRQPETALGGLPPRWSIEATVRDTPEGLQLTVDGWCLVNADVVWVRFVIDDVTRRAAIGLPRPDVHDVLNRQGFYHPLNALCSGLRATLLYEGLQSRDGQCAVRLEVALGNGLVVQAPAARPLPVNETVTLAQ